MYNGGLVTLVLKDSSKYVSKPISELEGEFDDNGFKLVERESKRFIGYLIDTIGIDLEEFLDILSKVTELTE